MATDAIKAMTDEQLKALLKLLSGTVTYSPFTGNRSMSLGNLTAAAVKPKPAALTWEEQDALIRTLPVNEEGDRYVTSLMVANDSELRAMVDASINSWNFDPTKDRWTLSIGFRRIYEE